jgi:hypothetical protein
MSNIFHPPNDSYWYNNEYNFNLQKFSWINIELIDALRESLQSPKKKNSATLSDQEFIDLIEFRKFKYEKRTIPYPRLRNIADFLGFPPWYFFKAIDTSQIDTKYDTTNRVVEDMYTHALPNLPEVEMRSTWGIINSLLKRNLDRGDIIFLEGLREKVKRNEVCEDWIFVIKELEKINENDSEFEGAATINIGNDKGLNNTGTFRYCKGQGQIHNHKYTIEWNSAWFAVDTDENDDVSLNHLNYIVNDITRIIDKPPWKFVMNIEKKTRYLYSWHSLRNMNIESFEKNTSKVDDLLEKMLPIAINRLYCMHLRGYQKTSQTLVSKYNYLLSWLAGDLENKDTLEFLIDINYIKEHDRLVFKQSNIFLDKSNALIQDESIFYGSVVVLDKKPQIMWEYDRKVYSISQLTQLINLRLTGQDFYPNGNKYWRKLGENNSLYEIREIVLGKK